MRKAMSSVAELAETTEAHNSQTHKAHIPFSALLVEVQQGYWE